MASQDWRGVSELFAVLAAILIIGGIIAYFYQTTYVTWFGTYYAYPYRGYTLTLAIGAIFCFIASFIADQISNSIPVLPSKLPPSVTVMRKYCTACGAEVPLDAEYCPRCGRPFN
jgi:hypothetical protein